MADAQFVENVRIEGDDRTEPAVRSATARLNAFERTMRNLGRLTISPLVRIRDMATAPLRAITSGANSLVGVLGKVGLAAMGIQALGSTLSGIGDALGVGAAASFEQTRVSLLAMNGSVEATDALLARLQDEASHTPFSFDDMATAAAALSPALKGTNIDMLDAIRLGERMSVLNPAQGFEGASFAIREALSGDWTSAISRFNLPRSEINKLKDEGVPALEILDRVMGKMGITMDLVNAQGETFNGIWSTVTDTWEVFKRTLATPLFERLKDSLRTVRSFLEGNAQAVSDLATQIGGKLADGFGWALDMGTRLFKTMQTFLAGPLGQKMIGIANGLGDAISAILQAIPSGGGSLGVLGDLVEAAFGPKVAGYARAFLSVGMQVIKTVGRIGTVLGAIFEGKLSFADVFASAKSIFGELGKTIKHEAGVLGGRLWEWFTDEARPALNRQFALLIDRVGYWVRGGGLERLKRNLLRLADGAWSWLKGAAGKASDFLNDHIVQPIKDWASSGDGPRNTAAALAGLAAGAWSWLSTAALDAGTWLGANIVDPIRNWVTRQGGIEGIASALGGLANNVWDWLSTAAGNAGAFLEANVLQPIREWVAKGGPGKVAAALGQLAMRAWDWVVEAAKWASTNLGPIVTSIQSWATDTAAPAMLAAGKSLGQKLYDGLDTGFDAAVTAGGLQPSLDKLGQGLDRMKVSESLNQSWINWGASLYIVEGFLNDINDAMGGPGTNFLMKAADTIGAGLAITVGILAKATKNLSAKVLDNLLQFKNTWDFFKENGADLLRYLQQAADVINAIQNPAQVVSNAVTGATAGPPPPGVSTGVPTASGMPHAAGGIVTRPHLGLVGEAGPEAIVPLSEAARYGFGGGDIHVGDLHVSLSFAGGAPAPEDARKLARRLAPELAREFARELRKMQPGVVGGVA